MRRSEADEHGQERAAGAAIPIGNKVCGNIFDARYEPGTRTNVMAMMLWMNPIYETSAGGEKTGETEMHAGEDRVDDVAANVLDAQHDHGGIGGEQTNDEACGQFHDDGDGDAIRTVIAVAYLSVRIARSGLPAPNVLRGYRRNGGKHGGWYEEQHADHLFDHADGAASLRPR